MINFFRRIRQKLVSSNKFSKYLLYAIGEILLVVIGILIALQFNNWNEERLAKNQERQVVKTLSNEFEANLKELKYDIKRMDTVITNLRILFDLFGKNDLPKEEIVDSLIIRSNLNVTWNPSSYVLNDLKNSGQISRLSNTDLQSALFKWERHYENLLEHTNDSYVVASLFMEYIRENGSLRNMDDTYKIPNKGEWGRSRFGFDNSSLLLELEFENIVDDRLVVALMLKDQYSKSVEIIEELLSLTEL